MHDVLFRSLPVHRPSELYRLGDTTNCCVNSGLQGSHSLFSFACYEHRREATRDEFLELATFQANRQPVAVRRGGQAAVPAQGQFVTATYFRMFGVGPAAGRVLEPEDDRPDAAPVVVVSHRVWTEQFGADPSLVGSSVLVDGRSMTVAGVARRRRGESGHQPRPCDVAPGAG